MRPALVSYLASAYNGKIWRQILSTTFRWPNVESVATVSGRLPVAVVEHQLWRAVAYTVLNATKNLGDEGPANTEELFEIEPFVKYIQDDDEMDVEWKGYSSRNNTIKLCSKLQIGQQFELLRREVLDLDEGPLEKGVNEAIEGQNFCFSVSL
eukprot:gb/GECG01004003.1/.p1 GENE.gb/GECG01004003.1/~~gb/GECG01004003.1/.p1  ORF type:complete len:153 (+),score=18.12 gb/GECG01004003.1/:1-459(+)